MDHCSLPNTVKIQVSQLTLGMYVVELDRPWTDTPFLFQRFRITHPEDLRQLQALCSYVWVDSKQSTNPVEQQIKNLVEPPRVEPAIAKVKFEQDVRDAEPIWKEARETSLRILEAVKLGRELDVDAVRNVVKGCVESILQSPSAMLWLARIKNRDEYTAEHSLRVGILAIALGRELGLLPLQLEELGMCGILHDVGKIKVPDAVLNKPGRLNDDEMRIMRSHAREGRQLLLSNKKVSPMAVDVAYAHHERVDGRGYPRGLTAEKIPYFAKIISVVDCYDAINSDRIYSKGKSTLEALRILYEARDSDFDAEIVSHFIRTIGIYPPGEIVEFNTGEVGIILGCPPESKLKPRVLCVLGANKQPCKERVLDLGGNPQDERGRLYLVSEIHSNGAFGIDIDAYRRKGLIVPANL